MESEDLMRYYLDEVKDTQHDINNIEVEEHIPNGKIEYIFLRNLLNTHH